MHIYKELTQPTVVTHSLTAKFIDKESKNLILVKGNSLLEIYRIKSVRTEIVDNLKREKDYDKADEEAVLVENDDSFIGGEIALESSKEYDSGKLVLIGQWPLHGYVTDIHSVQLPSNSEGRHSLLLSFKYAKLSLVTWDEDNHKIKTLSMHFYEKNMLDSHFFDSEFETFFEVDPQNNCAALIYQRDNLAILPFYQEDALDESTAASGDLIYYPSFLIRASRLDDSLTNIINFAFLHEYREPTLAFLFEPTRTWTGTLPLHKDTVRYLVLSLDLKQRSSTAITSLQNLPYDTAVIVPLQEPLNGSLLVGANQLIHVDSSGKTTGVAVNTLAKLTTSFNLEDQSSLELKLEGCKISQLEKSSELLMIVSSGQLYSVSFKVEGRRIYGFSIAPLANPKQEWLPRPSSISVIDSKHVFCSSLGAPAQLLGVSRQGDRASKVLEGGKLEVPKDDIDDIYGDDDVDMENGDDSGDLRPLKYVVHDTLANYGPISSFTVGKPRAISRSLREGDPRLLGHDIVAATGVGVRGSLSIFRKTLRPDVISDLRLHTAEEIWSLKTRAGISGDKAIYDTYVVTSDASASTLYKVEPNQLKNVTKSSAFDGKGSTVAIGIVASGSAVVRVEESFATIYDADFKVSGKKVEFDDRVINASFLDPYCLVELEKGEAVLLQASTTKSRKPSLEVIKNQAEEKSTCATLASSSLFSQLRFETKKRKRASDTATDDKKPTAISVEWIGEENVLKIHKLGDRDAAVVIKGMESLPPITGVEIDMTDVSPKAEKAEFVQVVYTTLGDGISSEEYLVLLTATYEVYLYKAMIYRDKLRFEKVRDITNMSAFKYEEDVRLRPLNIGEYHILAVLGSSPHLLIKGYNSPVRLHQFDTRAITGITDFNTDAVNKGYIFVDDSGVVRICNLDPLFDYTQSTMPVQQVPMGGNVSKICYHETGRVYAIATSEEVPFEYLDEDENKVAGLLEDVQSGISYQCKLKLVSPLTWTVIDERELDKNEVILDLKSVLLNISEKSDRKKEVLVFGTSVLRGEDLASKGLYYVYDAVGIVPEPGKPETDRKLKELAKELVKGSVTSLCEIKGHLAVAQGQKIIIRNLQDDDSIMPVAFLDVNVYIKDCKSVSNILLLGDSTTSVWLAGFGIEPFRMSLMGKDLRKIQVSSSEFVVSKGKLFSVFADYGRTLHLIQYDPEDPTSLAGQRLIPKSDFYTGRVMQTMALVPNDTVAEDGERDQDYVPLCGSDDGVLSVVLPISEQIYRTLFVVQNQIIDKDEHVACLNPRMHRVTTSLFAGNVNEAPGQQVNHQQMMRAILDYNVIQRFGTLGIEKKYQFSRKVGAKGEKEVWGCLKDLESCLGRF